MGRLRHRTRQRSSCVLGTGNGRTGRVVRNAPTARYLSSRQSAKPESLLVVELQAVYSWKQSAKGLKDRGRYLVSICSGRWLCSRANLHSSLRQSRSGCCQSFAALLALLRALHWGAWRRVSRGQCRPARTAVSAAWPRDSQQGSQDATWKPLSRSCSSGSSDHRPAVQTFIPEANGLQQGCKVRRRSTACH